MNPKALLISSLIVVAFVLVALLQQKPEETVETTVLPISERGIVVNGEEQLLSSLALEQPKLSYISPEKLSLSQFDHVKTDGTRQIMVLADGSSLELNAGVLAKLPEDIRARVSYER